MLYNTYNINQTQLLIVFQLLFLLTVFSKLSYNKTVQYKNTNLVLFQISN